MTGQESPDGRTVTITAQSFEVYSQKTDIGFAPPFAQSSSDPDAFEFWWKMIQYVFDLPSPYGLTALECQLDDHQSEIIERFISEADELASSDFISHPSKVEVQVVAGTEESVETDFARKEILRGFSTTFRQFFGKDEVASFSKVMNVLWQLNEKADDEGKEHRAEFVRTWRKAEGKLQQSTANVLVGKKAQALGVMGGNQVPFESHPSPARLIAAFFHGDLIHFGKRREELSLYADCDFSDANYQMTLMRGLSGLTHLYLGVAVALRAVFPPENRQDP